MYIIKAWNQGSPSLNYFEEKPKKTYIFKREGARYSLRAFLSLLLYDYIECLEIFPNTKIEACGRTGEVIEVLNTKKIKKSLVVQFLDQEEPEIIKIKDVDEVLTEDEFKAAENDLKETSLDKTIKIIKDAEVKMESHLKDLVTFKARRCENCKHLEIINKDPVYAMCVLNHWFFLLWGADTRKTVCSLFKERID